MNADHQGSAPSFEEDSGVLGVKKELNCVPILLRLMQKGVYSSYTLDSSPQFFADCKNKSKRGVVLQKGCRSTWKGKSFRQNILRL